jgi:hypothetical protein
VLPQYPGSRFLSLLNVTTKECTTGYGGTACAECVRGYYRLGALCTLCPSVPWLPVLGFSLVLGRLHWSQQVFSRAHRIQL